MFSDTYLSIREIQSQQQRLPLTDTRHTKGRAVKNRNEESQKPISNWKCDDKVGKMKIRTTLFFDVVEHLNLPYRY